MTDLEIAKSTELYDIREIAKKLGLSESDLELYGKHKAKISESAFEKLKNKQEYKIKLTYGLREYLKIKMPIGTQKSTAIKTKNS